MWLSRQLTALFVSIPKKEQKDRNAIEETKTFKDDNVSTDPSSPPIASYRVRHFLSQDPTFQPKGLNPDISTHQDSDPDWLSSLQQVPFDTFPSPFKCTETSENTFDPDRSFVLAERNESSSSEKQVSQTSLPKSDTEYRIYLEVPNNPKYSRDALSQPTSGSFRPVFQLVEDPPLGRKIKLKKGVVGLENPKLYCYLNASIQCLFSSKAFREYLINLIVSHPDLPETCELTYLLALLARRMFSLKTGKVHSSRLWHYIKRAFSAADMHDVPEALCFLLNTINTELKSANIDVGLFPSSSQALAWFEGSLFSQIECCSCHNLTTTVQSFIELSLSLTKSLSQSLSSLTADEVLETSYTCRSCSQSRSAVKRLHFDRLPENLLITFLRFRSETAVSKLTSFVKFSKSLTLTTYLIASDQGGVVYTLMSVVVHKGTAETGHYVAYSKRGHSWYLFDDARYER